MSGTITIFKKELKGFFLSPSFYVIAFLVSVVLSWSYPIQLNLFSQLLQNYVFQQNLPNMNQLNIHYGLFLRHLSYLNLMLIFVVPALTMRLLAEEKKLRTFDLLLTSPVTSTDIVLGKYLAALAAVGGIVLLALSYPVATATMTKLSWGPLLIAFLGIFLVGAAYAAMNLFCSSLTENALVAYVTSVVFNVSIWFVGIGVEMTDSQTIRQIIEHVSINTHLSSLVEGTIRTSALVFLVSLVALFCFLAERVVESSRWR
ncbi:MAG: ABC transporter permease [Bdellovibrionales bacterium]|nr:ABC transporter permease [Bdellovibrionales bacterium]